MASLLAVIGAGVGAWTLWYHLTADPMADVHAYYDAAVRLNNGSPLYPPGADNDAAAFYRYPPLLAIAFRPLAFLPFEAAAAIWATVCLATFGLTLWRLGLRRREVWISLGILGMPIAWALGVGQAQVPVTWLLVEASPAAVALAANLKLMPGLVAVYWVARRDWRSAARFLGWSTALVAVQSALEPRGVIAFVQLTNLSEVGDSKVISPYAISPILWVVLVAALAVTALRLGRTRWGWAAAVTFSVLATPRLLAYVLMSLLAGFGRRSERRAAESPTSQNGPRPLD